MINIVEFCDVVYIEKWNQVNDVVRIVFWINLLNHSNSMKVSWGKNVVMLIYNSKILLFWIYPYCLLPSCLFGGAMWYKMGRQWECLPRKKIFGKKVKFFVSVGKSCEVRTRNQLKKVIIFYQILFYIKFDPQY